MTPGHRIPWRVGHIVDTHHETPAARTLTLDVPDWPGHLAGQHLDLRLTAPDGYHAQRSYSLATPTHDTRIQLTIQHVTDGEVSPYLVSEIHAGDDIELRGPVGGWFTWQPRHPGPVLLIAGGSGIVPLAAMIRARAAAHSPATFRLIYSARTPDDVYYADELHHRAHNDTGLHLSLLYTRAAPDTHTRTPHRISPDDLTDIPTPDDAARSYICGPTGFVETVARMLVDRGHDPRTVRTERFGPSGG
ncbi:MAG: ferredoxin reductase [Actinocatenispora sp.]